MRRPRWLQLCRSGTRLCAEGVGSIVLWALWLALLLALGLQVAVAMARELKIPDFALRRIEQRLATAGLQARFGAATFDPTGHVLLRDVSVSLRSLPEPVLKAETLHLELDPWALLVRSVRVRSVQLSRAQLLVPALLSPSGRTEPLVSDWHAFIRPGDGRQGLSVPHLNARVGPVQVHVQGEMPPRRTGRPRRSVDEWLSSAAAFYPRFSRQLAQRLHQLPLSPDSRLSLVLTPELAHSRTRVDVQFSATSGGGAAAPGGVRVQDVGGRMVLHLPMDDDGARTSLHAELAIGHVATRLQEADRVTLAVDGSAGAGPGDLVLDRLILAAAAVRAEGLTFGAPRAELDAAHWPRVGGSVVTRVFEQPWTVTGELDGRTRAGELEVDGAVTTQLLDYVGRRLQRDLRSLLAFDAAPRAQAEVALGPGGRPARASARIHAGPVVARGVELQGAGGLVHWQGDSVEVEDIRLRTATSEARGRYEMKLGSRDFRLFLGGHLQPADIDGWFRPWWSRFWDRFEFTVPPDAEVEVSGRWGAPHLTAVFVAADGAPVTLQGAAFDRVRTRLFVRPGYVDVLGFIGERQGREARGSFTRTTHPGDGNWARIVFDARGNTDLAPAADLFGDIGATITRPFHFDQPPHLHVAGELRRGDAEGQRHIDVRIEGQARGDWTFYRFPLQDLTFKARVQDDVLLVEELEAGFAGGRGTGRAELRGWERERRLAFDVALSGARLGESIRTLETWSAERHDQPPPPVSRFQQQVAPGQLDLALSAEGRYDDPYSLTGAGNAVITGADFGEINLFGILSSLLRPTILNFTTLQLDTARANFDLLGHTLEFRELRLSGPRAAIEAQGGYRLDTKGLSFVAKIRPFGTSDTFLGVTFGAVLSPLTNVLEVKLTGVLDQPSWSFVYGPTNLLRVLSGESSRPPDSPAVEPPAPQR